MRLVTLPFMPTITLNDAKFPVGTQLALYPAAAAAHGVGLDRAPGGAVAVAPATASGTATTTSGSNQLTLVTNPGQWTNGMVVSGAGIPANTRVVSGGGTATLTMSQNATASAAGVAITGTEGKVADNGAAVFSNAVADTSYVAYANVSGAHRAVRVRGKNATGPTSVRGALGQATATANTSNGSAALSSVAVLTGNLAVGQRVSGPGIPSGARLISGSGASWTMSAPATATGTGVAIEAAAGNTWTARVRARRTALGTA